MIRNILSVATLLGLSVLALPAQEPPPAKVELRMLAFQHDQKFKDAYIQDPAAPDGTPSIPSPVKTYLNHQFSVVQLKSRKVAITTAQDHASLTRPGELIGEVTLPDKVNSAILLFLPGKPGGNARCQILVIDDSKRAFPAGSFHITNLSPLPVKLFLENKPFDFAPGKALLIENPPAGPNQHSDMKAFVNKDEKWLPVATTIWQHPGDARGVKVLFLNPKSNVVEVRSFDDGPPRVQQAQDPATASQP